MPDPAADRDAIRNLLACYSYNGDRGRLTALAACFTVDGVLEYPGHQPQGPDAIQAALSSGRRNPKRSFVRHHITNPLILLDADQATARSYFTVFSNAGPDHAGTYDDWLVRTPDGWRIARRRVRIDWQSADSLFEPMATRQAT